MIKNILILIGVLAIGFYVYQNFLLKAEPVPVESKPVSMSEPLAVSANEPIPEVTQAIKVDQETSIQSNQTKTANTEDLEPVYEPRITDPILIR